MKGRKAKLGGKKEKKLMDQEIESKEESREKKKEKKKLKWNDYM